MEKYSYFKDIYSDCEDSVICIDSKLNVIFATKSVYAIFDTDSSSFSNISYVLPMRTCYTLQDIMQSSKRSSFISRNVVDGQTYKFTVIPYPVDDDKCFLISITLDTSGGTSERDRFINTALKITDRELMQNTASIITASEGLSVKESMRVVNCVRRIRKLFDSFYTVVCENNTPTDTMIIDVNRYLAFFIDVLFKFTERDKVDIRFMSSVKSAYVQISQQTLDVICCNVIATIIKSSPNKKVSVSITVDRTDDNCLILFTDDNPPSQYSQNDYNALSIALIEKLMKTADGSVFFSSNAHRGNTVALNFMHCDMADTLCAPKEFDCEGALSTFAVMLSDI